MFTGIRLQHFRSYGDQAFELDPGVNIVVGPNASGKTNLLEALYVAARGKSFRARDVDLVRHGRDWARIDAYLTDSQRTVKIVAEPVPQRTIELPGDKSFSRMPAAQALPVVLFVPDHLRLIHGSPRLRRDYLDELIAQLYPEGISILRRYQRALAQRNAILKQPRPDRDELFVWGVKLGELGGAIARWRQEIIKSINDSATPIYRRLSKTRAEVRFEYRTPFAPKANYQQALNRKLHSDEDIKRGFTTHGPHRDDLGIMLGGTESNVTASRGESRTLVLVAKLVEAAMLEKHFAAKPLLLFDDVFSELDSRRRQLVAEQLRNYQTLITTTDADAVVENFQRKDTRTIAVTG